MGAPVSLSGTPVMNGVGSLTREVGCARELVRASQVESRIHQYVMGKIIGIVPHWLWGGLDQLKSERISHLSD
jgi:hypothetical protein